MKALILLPCLLTLNTLASPECERHIREVEYSQARDRRVPFTQVCSSGLHEAWKDEAGTIWGAMVLNSPQSERFCPHAEPGEPCRMNQMEAMEYCEQIGARLPEEEDFERLRSYLGATEESSHGYRDQVLPDLRSESGDGYRFWAMPEYPLFIFRPYYFDTTDGELRTAFYRRTEEHEVRCIRRR
jgi:hypothetical protein